MAITDMKVFNQYLYEATIETVTQEIDKFNGQSNGAIVLSADGFDGDFLQEAMFKSLHSAQRRVNRYQANASVSSTSLEQIQDNSVKVAGGFGPIVWEPSQLTWIRQNEAQAIELISRNLTEAIMQDQLNTGIASAVGAISNVADLTNDVSGSGAITYSAMNDAHAKFGDRSSSLVASIMNGATYHKLVGQNLTNATRLYEYQGVLIVDILGKPTIITDSSALYEAGTPNKAKVLSLSSGGIMISNAGDLITNIDTSNGNERIDTTMQADYTFGVGLKGFAWDTANGGKSPDDATLSTGTNWDKYVTSNKDTAGVITIGDADA